LREAEVPPLVLPVEALERGVVGREVADAHAPADLAPEVEVGAPLPAAAGPPAEARVPADRLVDEGGEDVPEVVVGDGEAAVQLVHAPQGAPAAVAVVAALQQLAEEAVGVVVALLRPAGELAG